MGQTSQGAHLEIQVDRKRSDVTAVRFSISYACTGRRHLKLHVLVLRPDDSWAIVDRTPLAVLGFSDWFSGPIGHDFHITGTFSADSTALTGTLHSVLRLGHNRCDTGHLQYRAALGSQPFQLPAETSLTRSQYRRLPSGITIGAAERVLGPPNDRDVFHPTGVISNTLPGGASQTWLDYRWRGHPHRYFQFLFRAGRLIPGQPGRSIVTN
jgi:hypothetical protein